MPSNFEEYLSDEQIERYVKKYGIGNDEYIHCAYIYGNTLHVEILTDFYGDGELYIKTLDLKPDELCEIIGHCCNYGEHDCNKCKQVIKEEN